MHRPVSAARIAANRANAARSTGPRTPEGKERSARNARKHGLAAERFVVDQLEDIASLDNLRAELIAFYRPANPLEQFAVDRIALAQLALLRCAALEAGLFSAAMENAGDPTPNASLTLALGFTRMCAGADSWKLFLRYQAQSERQYRRAVEEFHHLRAVRDEFPNEPNAPAEPEQTTPDSLVSIDAFLQAHARLSDIVFAGDPFPRPTNLNPPPSGLRPAAPSR